MDILPVPPEEPVVRRFSEELWLPYNRELEDVVATFALAEDLDLDSEVEFRLDSLSSESYRAWVAVDSDGSVDEGSSLADVDGEFAGFITTDVEACPPVFDYPDRLKIGGIYVREPYRGTGLADDLMERAIERARAEDCGELSLDVDVDNERALAFYESYGFETFRLAMSVPVAGL